MQGGARGCNLVGAVFSSFKAFQKEICEIDQFDGFLQKVEVLIPKDFNVYFTIFSVLKTKSRYSSARFLTRSKPI